MPTKKEIIAGNIMIAEFMGGKYGKFKFPTGLKMNTIIIPKYGEFMEAKEKDSDHLSYPLKFHSSWEWMMPVIEKIGRIRHDNPFGEDLKMNEIIIDEFRVGRGSFFLSVFIWTGKWERNSFLGTYDPNDKKMSTARTYIMMFWMVAVEFIHWSNKMTKKKK